MNRRFSCAGGPAVLVAAAIFATGASAQEQGTFMRKALSTLGVVEEEKPPIDYRERPPLVVPPKYELVKPQDRAAQRTASWPVDPNSREFTPAEIAAQEKLRDELAQDSQDGTHIPTVGTRRRSSGGGLTSIVSEVANARRSGDTEKRRITGDGLKGGATPSILDEDDYGSTEKRKFATGPEPERKTLTQPPRGYRAPPKLDNIVVPEQKSSFNFLDPLGLFKKN